MIHYLHAGFFFICGFCILCDPYSRPGTEYLAPAFLYVNYPLDYVLPVIFYYYFQLLFDKNKSFRPVELLLFLPALIVLFYFMPYYLLPSAEKLARFPLPAPGEGRSGLHFHIIENSIFVWAVFCGFLTLKSAFIYLFKGIKQAKTVNFYLVVNFIMLIIASIADINEIVLLYKLSMLFIVAMLVSLALLSLRNPDFYLSVRKQSSQIKYTRSQIKSLNIPGVLKRIDDLMNIEEIFRDPEMTLEKLSRNLGINYQQLSEIINTYYQVNFKAFLNRYRIEAAKRELIAEDKPNILFTAMNCGFNSKSAFNHNFLNATGKTPSQWQNTEENQAEKVNS